MAGWRGEQGDTLVRRMRQLRRSRYPAWELVGRAEGEFLEASDGLATGALAARRGVPIKDQEPVWRGLLEALRGSASPGREPRARGCWRPGGDPRVSLERGRVSSMGSTRRIESDRDEEVGEAR